MSVCPETRQATSQLSQYLKTMNTLTNIKKRVRAAYKTRPRQTRALKLRELPTGASNGTSATSTSTASGASVNASEGKSILENGAEKTYHSQELNPDHGLNDNDHDVTSSVITPVESDSVSHDVETLSQGQSSDE